MKNILVIVFAAGMASAAVAGGKFQNEDFKSAAELVAAGGSVSQLLNDTKVWVTSRNKQLSQAIIDKDLGGIFWQEVLGGSALTVSGNGYITNNAAPTDLLLPQSCAIGDTIGIIGKGAGGWNLWSNPGAASQTLWGPTDHSQTSAGASVVLASSQNARDTETIVCSDVNTQWSVLSSSGSPTFGALSYISGMISYWKMEQTSGSLVDSVAITTAHNLTRNGSPSQVAGKFGFGYSGFSGSNYFGGTTYSDASMSGGSTPVAMEAWVKFNTNGVAQWISVNYSGSGNGLVALVVDATNNLAFGEAQASAARITHSIGTSLNDGLWHYVVGSWDNSSNFYDLWLDGSNVVHTSVPPAMGAADANGTLYVGSRNGGTEPWAGSIDDVVLWKGAAPTAGQVAARWNAGAGRPYR